MNMSYILLIMMLYDYNIMNEKNNNKDSNTRRGSGGSLAGFLR